MTRPIVPVKRVYADATATRADVFAHIATARRLHLHRVRFQSGRPQRPTYRWALQTEPSILCGTERCAIMKLGNR